MRGADGDGNAADAGEPSPAPSELTDSANFKGFGAGRLRRPEAGKKLTEKDALIQSLSAVVRNEGRGQSGTNVVLGSEAGKAATDEEHVSKWKELDERLGTEYPSMRNFKAIGAAEESYAEMVRETVSRGIGYAVPPMMVAKRASSTGKYWTVDVGPVEVKSQEQLVEIYTAIKADPRTKFMM